jgi:hypothetical protein
MNKNTATRAASQILRRGTRIVSFDYDGQRRNVLVGSCGAMATPRWGRAQNRAIRTHGDRTYLVGLVANEGQARNERRFKTFNVEKIRNPSFA